MNVAVRTVVGVDGVLVVLGAWCPTCELESLPHDRHGTCLFCDTIIYGVAGSPPPPPVVKRKRPRTRTGTGHQLSRERISTPEIVAALQASAVAKGRAPYSNEWMTLRPSRKTIYRRFGSWDAALVAAGLAEAA